MTQKINKHLWELDADTLKENTYYNYTIKIIGDLFDGSEVTQNRSYRFGGSIKGPDDRDQWAKVVKDLAGHDFELIKDFEILEQEKITLVHTPYRWANEDSEDKYIGAISNE